MEIADVARTRFNVVLFDVGKRLWPACKLCRTRLWKSLMLLLLDVEE